MNNIQTNKLNMYGAADTFFTDNNSVITANSPVMADIIHDFREVKAQIAAEAKKQGKTVKGITDDKSDAKHSLALLAAGIAGGVKAYAHRSGLQELARKVHFTQGELEHGKDADTVNNAKIVHEEAESILASLAPYNVTTAKMQALSAAIARYEELIGRRGSGKAILHAGAEIDFMPGTEVTYGSELDAYIQPYSCSNNIARMAYQANDDAAGEDNFVTTANRQPLETPDIKKKECNIKVYPNPTTGRLVIEIDSDDLNSDVILSDLAGKALFKTHISDSGRFEINLDRQNNGIYLLDVRNGKKREVFKIILAR